MLFNDLLHSLAKKGRRHLIFLCKIPHHFSASLSSFPPLELEWLLRSTIGQLVLVPTAKPTCNGLYSYYDNIMSIVSLLGNVSCIDIGMYDIMVRMRPSDIVWT
jgi:hypothetical protein